MYKCLSAQLIATRKFYFIAEIRKMHLLKYYALANASYETCEFLSSDRLPQSSTGTPCIKNKAET